MRDELDETVEFYRVRGYVDTAEKLAKKWIARKLEGWEDFRRDQKQIIRDTGRINERR